MISTDTFAFDVFLSHNSQDKSSVRQIAEALKSRGLRVWLDEWELIPGHPWQDEVERIIQTAKSVAVLIPNQANVEFFWAQFPIRRIFPPIM